jgi:hypothetical protein
VRPSVPWMGTPFIIQPSRVLSALPGQPRQSRPGERGKASDRDASELVIAAESGVVGRPSAPSQENESPSREQTDCALADELTPAITSTTVANESAWSFCTNRLRNPRQSYISLSE